MVIATSQTFKEPVVIRNIAIVAYLSHIYGSIVLWKSSLRPEFYFCVIKYAFLYLFYQKVYPYSDPIVLNFAFIAAVFNKATIFLNKFSC